LNIHQEPSVTFDEKFEKDNLKCDNKKDYLSCDDIIEKMQLTDKLKETLDCYLKGMKFVQIAKHFSVNLSTVWHRRMKLREIYNQKIGVYGNK